MDNSINFAPLTDRELRSTGIGRSGIELAEISIPTLPPADAENGASAAERLYGCKPDSIWRYSTAADHTAFYVARWNIGDSEKIVRPISWVDQAWKFRAWPAARPLYMLPAISARSDAAVVVCEGEKSADAAIRIFSNCVVTTSSGGSNAQSKTDWAPLAGRRVLIWPDNDDAGVKYGQAVATTLAALDCQVSIIDVKSLAAIAPDGGKRDPICGWDAADAVNEGRALSDICRDAWTFAKPFDAGLLYVSFGTYEMTEAGLTVEIERGSGDNKTTETIWIAAPFEIAGACRDPNGRSWGKWIRWRDADGRMHVQNVSDAELQGEPASICAHLASDGLRINRQAQRHLVNYLAAADVRGRVTVVSRTGWHEVGGYPVFVLPEQVFGTRSFERVIPDGKAVGPYEVRGSLQGWREGVAALASGHALPVLAISAAFAGVLLNFAEQDGGGVNFYGPSSIGKTTLMRAAASVWGRGDTPGYIRAWRATANGLEGAAAGATDTVLILDEISQAESREAAAAVYALANGAGKARAARDGALREPKSWRVLVLSSGEIPSEAKFSEDRSRKVRAGQLVRMLDIHCDRTHGVFDHTGDEGDAGKLAKAFRTAATSAYGTAGPEFVRRLIAGDVIGDDIRAMVDNFVAAHVPPGSDGQVDRAAQRFGLIATAGELATMFGIAPWREGEVTASAAVALAGWIARRGGTEAAEIRQAIEQVRLIIEAHGEARFQSLDDPEQRTVVNRLGWRKGSGADREWWIPPQIWKSEIANGLEPLFVARILAERRMLRRQGGNVLQCTVNIGRGSRVRAYVLTNFILDGGDDAL